MGMPENVRRVEDYPPYQSNWDGARASTPAETTLRLTLLHHRFPWSVNFVHPKKT